MGDAPYPGAVPLERTDVPLALDVEADAAYLHLHPDATPDAVRRTVCVDLHGTGVDAFFELDGQGRVLGVELLHATTSLPSGVLAALGRPATDA